MFGIGIKPHQIKLDLDLSSSRFCWRKKKAPLSQCFSVHLRCLPKKQESVTLSFFENPERVSDSGQDWTSRDSAGASLGIDPKMMLSHHRLSASIP